MRETSFFESTEEKVWVWCFGSYRQQLNDGNFPEKQTWWGKNYCYNELCYCFLNFCAKWSSLLLSWLSFCWLCFHCSGIAHSRRAIWNFLWTHFPENCSSILRWSLSFLSFSAGMLWLWGSFGIFCWLLPFSCTIAFESKKEFEGCHWFVCHFHSSKHNPCQ